MPYAVVDPEEPADEVEDGNSPNSYMSNADFDPDDTMASQQTAATEVTQPSQSRSSRVSHCVFKRDLAWANNH